jgi:hypothetical protein
VVELTREEPGETLIAFDADAFLARLGIQPLSDEDLERAMAELPEFDPPLSHVIIQMRDEERL